MTEPLYLVTGAGGFVGSWMTRRLLDEGKRVRAMVRQESQRADLETIGADVCIADLQQPESLAAAVEGITGVYHIASLFRQQGFSEEHFHDINAEGTRRLLEASAAAGVRRFVHCSTVGVHGHIENPPADEHAPIHPGDLYQRTKLAGEQIALEWFESGRMQGVVIRPAMIYGPRDARTNKLFRMVARKRFFYVGRGEGLVHWIDVRDLARAFHLAMEREEINAEVFIICGRRHMALREMCEIIAADCGVSPPKLNLPVKLMQWAGSCCEWICKPFGIEPPLYRRRVDFFTKHRSFDGSKAERLLGFEPAQDPEREIADILASYREAKML